MDATKQEVLDAITAEKAEVKEAIAAQAVKIKELEDKLAAGGLITAADLGEIKAAVQGII